MKIPHHPDLKFRFKRRPLFQYLTEQGTSADALFVLVNQQTGKVICRPTEIMGYEYLPMRMVAQSNITKFEYVTGFKIDLLFFTFAMTWLRLKNNDTDIKRVPWRGLTNDYTASLFAKRLENIRLWWNEGEFGSKQK